jgi:hypothetical protein
MLTRHKIRKRKELARLRARARWDKWNSEAHLREPSFEDIHRRALMDRKGTVFRVIEIHNPDGGHVTLTIRHSTNGRTDQYEMEHEGNRVAGPCGLSDVFDRIRKTAVKCSKRTIERVV